MNTISQRVISEAWDTYAIEYLGLWSVAIQILGVLFRNCFTPLGWHVSRLAFKYTNGSKRRRTWPLPRSAPIWFTRTWDIATCGLCFLGLTTLSLGFERVVDDLSFPLQGGCARVIFIYWRLYETAQQAAASPDQ